MWDSQDVIILCWERTRREGYRIANKKKVEAAGYGRWYIQRIGLGRGLQWESELSDRVSYQIREHIVRILVIIVAL